MFTANHYTLLTTQSEFTESMLFNSPEFALFLFILFALFWFIVQSRLSAQKVLLIITNYVSNGCWNCPFLGLSTASPRSILLRGCAHQSLSMSCFAPLRAIPFEHFSKTHHLDI